MGSKRKQKKRKRKSHKSNNTENNPLTQKQSKRKIELTDLNIDVLEIIFNDLALMDLLNMADTSKKFKPAVELVLRRKGIKGDLHLNIDRVKSIEMEILKTCSKGTAWSKTVVHDLLIAFKIVRNFGPLFHKLTIVYSTKVSQQANEELNRYLSKYCSKSLCTINLTNCLDNTIKGFISPFSKAATVEFRSIQLGDTRLDKWFPNVFNLRFDNVTMTNSDCIEAHFPNLRYLHFERVQITKNSLLTCLKLNSQILKLQTPFFGRCKFLQKVSKYLPHLEDFCINHKLKSFSGFGGDFQFKRMESLKINLEGTFNSKPLLSFIVKQPKITSLWVNASAITSGFDNDKRKFVLEFQKCLRGLETVQFIGFTLSATEVISFIRESKTLTLFNCTLTNDSDSKYLISKLSDEWEWNEWKDSFKSKNILFRRRNLQADHKFLKYCVSLLKAGVK